MNSIRWMFVLVCAGLLVALSGCNLQRLEVGPVQTESQTVELGGAETVRTQIRMGVGELRMQGGSSNLLDAEFTFNIDSWRPIVAYEVNGRNGALSVRQPEADLETAGIPTDEVRYEWDLRLNDSVPMDLDIGLGVGESTLVLGGLNLTGLDISTGVGQTEIDLSGQWSESFDVNIEGGVGGAVVRLPSSVGVRLTSQTGLGNVTINGLTRDGDDYVNAAFGESLVTLDVSVRGGVGEITIEVAQ